MTGWKTALPVHLSLNVRPRFWRRATENLCIAGRLTINDRRTSLHTYAESVLQRSRELADRVGQPWVRVSLHGANSERVEQAIRRNSCIDPDAFHYCHSPLKKNELGFDERYVCD